MQELDIALEVLGDIVNNDVEFSEALRKKFQPDPDIRPLRSSVAGLVGCELRHHLLFSYLSEPLKELTPEDRLFVALVLANEYFFRRLDSALVNQTALAHLGAEKLTLVQPLLDKTGKPEEYITSDLDKSGNKYLSLRYNTPEWVLKVWQHYGYGTTYKILKKDNHQLTTSLRVRTSLVSTDSLVGANPQFVKMDVPDMVSYTGKDPLRKTKEFRLGQVFEEKPAAKAALDKFRCDEPEEAMLYCGKAEVQLAYEFLEKFTDRVGVNIGVPNTDEFPDVSRRIRDMGLSNVNFYGAKDPLHMDAAISRPQDLVVCAPDSTNFDLIREYPDYLLHFKKDSMDLLFAGEEAALEGCSKFVADDGTLLYLIFTVSKKEGHRTVDDFLAKHNNFKLVREVQHFPFEAFDTALYVAVLHKEDPLAKAGAPLMDLSALTAPKIQPTSEAQGKAE